MSQANLIQRLEKYKDGEMDYCDDGDYCRFYEVEDIIKELETENKNLTSVCKEMRAIIQRLEAENGDKIFQIFNKL